MADLVKCEICGKELDKRGYNGHMATHNKKAPDTENKNNVAKVEQAAQTELAQNDPKTQNPEKEKNNGDFVSRAKIEPDQSLLTENNEEESQEEYQCYNCSHKWKAPADEYQERCPNCMVEFE